jgi:hypothetical protein
MSFPTCTPKRPLRCWQYHANDDAQALPLWVAAQLVINGKVITVDLPGGNDDWTLDDGDWLVEFVAGTDQLIWVYSSKEFVERFDGGATAPDGDADGV